MEQQMTWEQVLQTFPDEWVAFANYKLTGAVEVDGTVITHHSEKQKFHQTVRKLMPKYRKIAVRFTGELVKNADIPLLWQITHTESTKS